MRQVSFQRIQSRRWAGPRARRAGWGGSWLVAAGIALATVAPAADDPGARALHQLALERHQQQDALQLRMQQQRAAPTPPAEVRKKQSLERTRIEQRQRLQQLHDQQAVEPPGAQPSDDEGTRRAKREIERQEAQRASQQQLRRLDRELTRP